MLKSRQSKGNLTIILIILRCYSNYYLDEEITTII